MSTLQSPPGSYFVEPTLLNYGLTKRYQCHSCHQPPFGVILMAFPPCSFASWHLWKEKLLPTSHQPLGWVCIRSKAPSSCDGLVAAFGCCWSSPTWKPPGWDVIGHKRLGGSQADFNSASFQDNSWEETGKKSYQTS